MPVIPRIAVPWYALGLELGAKDYTLDLIQQSHKDDHEKCCREMLLNWLLGKQDSGNCPRTWNDLLRVIESVAGSKTCAFIKEILNLEEEYMDWQSAKGGPKLSAFVLSYLCTYIRMWHECK